MQTKQYPIDMVDWVDSCSIGTWKRPEQYQEESYSVCQSVGFLINKDAEKVTLLQSRALETGNLADGIVIPRVAVTKITKLKSANKKRRPNERST